MVTTWINCKIFLKKMGEDRFLTLQNNNNTRHNWVSNDEHVIKPLQIQASKGDVILCHPFLAHHVAPNITQNIRYGVFVRPTRMDHFKHISTILQQDMWAEYPGLTNIK